MSAVRPTDVSPDECQVKGDAARIEEYACMKQVKFTSVDDVVQYDDHSTCVPIMHSELIGISHEDFMQEVETWILSNEEKMSKIRYSMRILGKLF